MPSHKLQTNTLLALVAASLLAQEAIAFAQPPVASQSKPAAFDVVSIKPNNSGHNGGAWGVGKNEYTSRNTPLSYIILEAYFGNTTSSADRIKNAPSWVTTDPYDITAKVDDIVANSWKGLRQSQQVAIAAPMLRTMLEDRCRLIVHKVPTEIQGYALVIGKHPVKLTPYQPNEPLPKNYGRFEGGWMIAYSEPGAGTQPYTQFFNITMAELTEFMSMNGGPIIDETGLTGNYDFKLFRSEIPPPSPPEDGAAPRPLPHLDPAHLFDWQAAGLELKPIKVPSFDIVIDHIERPSEN